MGANVEADRNLLFGILALQNGLIEQADLIAAFQCWTKERSRPMARVPRRPRGTEPGRSGDARRPGPAPRREARRRRPSAGPRSPRSAPANSANSPEPRPDDDRLGGAGLDPEASRRLGLHPGPDRHRKGVGSTCCGTTPRRDRHGLRGAGFGAAPRGRAQADPDPARRRPHQPRRGSCSRPRSPAGWSIPASSRSTAWGPTSTAGPTMPCGSSAARASRRPSTASIGPIAQPGRDPAERTLALRQLLRRFIDVCNAIAYAHSRGVHPPRPQAGEYPAGPLRRDPGRRLGPGQGRRPRRPDAAARWPR